MPEVTIDGVRVDVEYNNTILDAARKAGIWIPTLCYHPSLPPSGSCRLCMVEVESEDRKGFVSSCNYPVRSNIIVNASSERVKQMRKGVMELLIARAPESRELRELAEKLGVSGTPYPKVTEAQDNCILCGLCVAVCEEVMGCSAISFAGRGVERVVSAPFRLPSDACIACGACAVVCPVGTIQVRIYEDSGEAEIHPFKSRVKLITCEECGRLMVPEPVAIRTSEKVKINWEEFRRRARLCPACRRKKTVEALSKFNLNIFHK